MIYSLLSILLLQLVLYHFIQKNYVNPGLLDHKFVAVYSTRFTDIIYSN